MVADVLQLPPQSGFASHRRPGRDPQHAERCQQRHGTRNERVMQRRHYRRLRLIMTRITTPAMLSMPIARNST